MHADANDQKGGEGVPKLRYSRCRVVFFTSSFRLPFANSRFSGSLSASGNFTPPSQLSLLVLAAASRALQACLPQNDPKGPCDQVECEGETKNER